MILNHGVNVLQIAAQVVELLPPGISNAFTISDLKIGSYTVTETGDAFKDTDGTDLYIHSQTIMVGAEKTGTVTIDADGETVSIENKYDKAKLEVTKTVSGLPDTGTTATFTFTIEGAGLVEGGVQRELNYPDDFTNGSAKITLTNKDGIRLNTEYTVTESVTGANVTGYTRTTTVASQSYTEESGNAPTGTVTTDATTGDGTIAFTNDYTQKTVELPVSKIWAFADPSNVTKVADKEWPTGVTVHVVVYSKTGVNEPTATTYERELTAEAPSYTFTGLPEYDGENKIDYSVVEAGVTGLDSTNFSNDDDSTTTDDEKEYVYKVEETDG